MSITRKQIFETLTLARGRELAADFGIEGLTGLNKPDFVAILSRKRSLPVEYLLHALKRAELKTLCEAQGLDSSGREKQPLIDRLLGNEPPEPESEPETEFESEPPARQATPKPRPAPRPADRKREPTAPMFEQTFKNIDNVLWKEAGCATELDYTEQTSWMLFLKYLDDLERRRADEAELRGKDYAPIIEEAFRWSSWAAPKDEEGNFDHDNALTGPDLITFVNTELFPYLQGFRERAANTDTIEYKIGEIFSEIRNKFQSGYSLRDALEYVDALSFRSQKEKHELSHLYEAKIRNMGNAGRNGGEYYTPRPLIRAMIRVIDPRIGETIYDAAAGSCGFLCEAYDYLRYGPEGPDGANHPKLSTQDLETLQTRTFTAKEKKSLPYVIGLMNMILHGIEAPNIIHTNSLTEKLADIQEKNRFDIILANPPFGGKERKEIQNNFDIRTGETAFLFLQHFIKHLKAGGRAAIVIKNTFLSNSDNASRALRRELLENCNLHTILDCPGGTFLGAGVKTVVLFFEKGRPTQNIWYYHLDPGRSLGKTSPLNDDDLQEFVELQASFADSDESWTVNIEDIDPETWDLSVKNPNKVEEDPLRDPEVIINEIETLDRESEEILEGIRGML
ncbi:type I restriction-modification system methyltransferase subunit [Thiohalobacter thiocyanaticus]|uniref:site-specific DNA-methyltransferase (adenine-specific) n=2 Tax=Thiohalobacter thiocyanaticus TaxID=585455 RepID=A0A1Z4VSP3_9GAMM|nr:N-6 DNA methylase [Thiohalobacter thiocyanaticus]BAZ94432.1 type I restriction-modification system methyltransferase subunit [Thiohalobacter thiocyanaticus]